MDMLTMMMAKLEYIPPKKVTGTFLPVDQAPNGFTIPVKE
jgi:hypothetical protein